MLIQKITKTPYLKHKNRTLYRVTEHYGDGTIKYYYTIENSSKVKHQSETYNYMIVDSEGNSRYLDNKALDKARLIMLNGFSFR